MFLRKDKKSLLAGRDLPRAFLGACGNFPTGTWRKVNNSKQFLKKTTLRGDGGGRRSRRFYLSTFQHTYSHFKLTLHVYHCQVLDGTVHGKWVPLRRLHLLPHVEAAPKNRRHSGADLNITSCIDSNTPRGDILISSTQHSLQDYLFTCGLRQVLG